MNFGLMLMINKTGIPIFMTLNYRTFATWLKEYNYEKWASLSDEDKKALIKTHWVKLYSFAGDYNIE